MNTWTKLCPISIIQRANKLINKKESVQKQVTLIKSHKQIIVKNFVGEDEKSTRTNGKSVETMSDQNVL